MKKAFGFLAVLAASAVMMCASAYAATTYQVATVAGEAGGTVSVPLTVTADTADEQINGYVVTYKYDPAKVTPVLSTADQGAGVGKDSTGSDCYATAGTSFTDGIIVSDSIDNEDGTKTLAIAWAAATPVTLTANEVTQLADVSFTVASDATENVTLEVQAATVAKNGTDAPATVDVASGAIELSSFLYGDVDNNGAVDSYDASLVSKYNLSLITLDADALKRGDVDGSGVVDSYDASLISKYNLGLLLKFPIEG